MIRLQGAAPCEIRIRRGSFPDMPAALAEAFPKGTRFALMGDSRVVSLYARPFLEGMEGAGLSCSLYSFSGGEVNKNLGTWAGMLTFLARENLTRGDCVIALGGGVTGDLAAFAASARRRGIGLVHIPTSLTAMADSCIGGKCGFDFLGEKNSVGAFYPASLVLIDPNLLQTLPAAFFTDGCAELIKYGMIADAELFHTLSNPGWQENIEGILEKCLQIKADLCAEDPLDRGRRRLLNFGHTFGHMLEAYSGFTLPHGRAVAQGMRCAAHLSHKLGLCDASPEEALERACRQNGLEPVALPKPEQLCLRQDKKQIRGEYSFILPRSIGRCEVCSVDEETALSWLAIAMEGSTAPAAPANGLAEFRQRMDAIDSSLMDMLTARMALSDEIGRLKGREGLPVQDGGREADILAACRLRGGEACGGDLEKLYRSILETSRERQRRINGE